MAVGPVGQKYEEKYLLHFYLVERHGGFGGYNIGFGTKPGVVARNATLGPLAGIEHVVLRFR
jgi:hypothetical protein